jgi:hypothetical protein
MTRHMPTTRSTCCTGDRTLVTSAGHLRKITKRSKKIQRHPIQYSAEHNSSTRLARNLIDPIISSSNSAVMNDRNLVNLSLESDSTPLPASSEASDLPQAHLDAVESDVFENVMAPAPNMWPALIRVYEDRIVRVTLLKREEGGATNLFPSRSSISAARVLLVSAVLASGSALSTKAVMSSMRALPLCAIVHNTFDFGAPKPFALVSSAPSILQGLSMSFSR